MSKASVDLPEPLTPVMTLNWPRGMLTLRFLRLCSLALTIWMAPCSCEPREAGGTPGSSEVAARHTASPGVPPASLCGLRLRCFASEAAVSEGDDFCVP